ncbi:MAG TPA: 2-oxoglutarate dehydrogenase, E2 component, dihydrolipoamide succinyltransferase [Verrucomicrobiae bacterium]|jgi:pyruvate dehydrogenase E2 component (dihydrolipoamide acetyltransferase)|nr:2-oxoglutarate dehydrogenase, E2 component, dihydrolipoamide succinyltransferase [Verrucomicrobiae bacterium]
MAVDVIMPQMGESIFEGTITRWLKKPGDRVERDEPLFEISTDKVDAEIPAPSAGVLKEIKVNEGQTVPIQTVVAVIDAAGAQAATSPAPAAAAPATAAPAPKAAAASAAPTASATPPPAPAPAAPAPRATAPAAAPAAPVAPSPGGNGQKIRSSPLVRKLAKEHNVDLAAVEGSGAGGRISKKDILAAASSGAARPAPAAASAAPATAAAPAAASAPPPATGGAQAHPALENAVPRERIYFGSYEAQPMSVMRQRIAEHMVASKRVSPHVYSIDEADMTKIARIRERSKAAFEEKYGTKLTFMPFFVRACVEALRAFPFVNASADGATVVLHREINVGIAVALDWGLIVPVIKNAEEKNFLGLARGINDLAERARSKKLKPEEVQEGTFSITNPGVYGGLMGLPVINQPNVAILGIGAIQKRAVVIDDAIAIRSMVYLTLSYDHRVVDGAVAHQFVGKVKGYLEGWTEEVL